MRFLGKMGHETVDLFIITSHLLYMYSHLMLFLWWWQSLTGSRKEERKSWQKLPCFSTLLFQAFQVIDYTRKVMEKSFSEVLGCQKHRVCHSIYKSSKLLISKNGTTQITSGSCSCLSNCSLFYKNTRIDDALPELPRFSKTKFTVVTRYARPSHEWRAITHAQGHRCHII